jgi:hypothetical protein
MILKYHKDQAIFSYWLEKTTPISKNISGFLHEDVILQQNTLLS